MTEWTFELIFHFGVMELFPGGYLNENSLRSFYLSEKSLPIFFLLKKSLRPFHLFEKEPPPRHSIEKSLHNIENQNISSQKSHV